MPASPKKNPFLQASPSKKKVSVTPVPAEPTGPSGVAALASRFGGGGTVLNKSLFWTDLGGSEVVRLPQRVIQKSCDYIKGMVMISSIFFPI